MQLRFSSFALSFLLTCFAISKAYGGRNYVIDGNNISEHQAETYFDMWSGKIGNNEFAIIPVYHSPQLQTAPFRAGTAIIVKGVENHGKIPHMGLMLFQTDVTSLSTLEKFIKAIDKNLYKPTLRIYLLNEDDDPSLQEVSRVFAENNMRITAAWRNFKGDYDPSLQASEVSAYVGGIDGAGFGITFGNQKIGHGRFLKSSKTKIDGKQKTSSTRKHQHKRKRFQRSQNLLVEN